MGHIVMIGLDIDAETYGDAVDRVERWLVSRREGNALELYPEGVVRVFTTPKLPHQPISLNVAPVRVYVEASEDRSELVKVAIDAMSNNQQIALLLQQKSCAHTDRLNGICKLCGFDLMEACIGNFAKPDRDWDEELHTPDYDLDDEPYHGKPD